MKTENKPEFLAAWEASGFSEEQLPAQTSLRRQIFLAGYTARDAEVERLRACLARFRRMAEGSGFIASHILQPLIDQALAEPSEKTTV